MFVFQLFADEPSSAEQQREIAFFETRVRPVLAQHCYSCHSRKSEKNEGNLRLDSREAIRKGGDRGPAVVPGDPSASILIAAISHADADLQMPPNKPRLSDTLVNDITTWIRNGAIDPRNDETAPQDASSKIREAARTWWAYQPLQTSTSPPIDDVDWPRGEIDQFIANALKQNGLEPTADADTRRLLRRMSFDLVGLPPDEKRIAGLFELQAGQHGTPNTTAERFEEWLEDYVDELLASPQFGERWGRHWLDVARFAESSGKESNVSFPYAWRYRDYVFDSFNTDKPFHRFLTEQIAGDLLPFDNSRQRHEQLIATGFLAIGPKGLNEMNPWQFLADVIDEQIDAVSRAVLGQSIACARCHDHKFEPYSMEDYYGLAGIFASTKTYYGTSVAPENQIGGDLLRLPEVEQQVVFNPSMPAAQVANLRKELGDLKAEERRGREAIFRAVANGEDPAGVFTLQDALRILWRSGAIEGQLKTVDRDGRALPLAMGVADRQHAVDVPLLERGEIARPGAIVHRSFPGLESPEPSPTIPATSSGRLELAQWLTQTQSALTSRVIVNRVWHHLFGAGLVRTVDNFGPTGELPSHGALLDFLATQFMKNGWSIKSLVREIVLSRAYRQDSTFRHDAFLIDPENRLLWRANKRRLDAEVIRDAMLSVSGKLELKRPAGSLVAKIGDRPISIIAFDKRVPADLDASPHRSAYLPVLRDRLPDVLELFDFAEPSLVTGARETTNVPVQSLYLMNSSFVIEQAQGLAKRLRSQGADDERIRLGYLLCFSREPDDVELVLAKSFLQLPSTSVDGAAQSTDRPLISFCHALLSAAEFRILD